MCITQMSRATAELPVGQARDTGVLQEMWSHWLTNPTACWEIQTTAHTDNSCQLTKLDGVIGYCVYIHSPDGAAVNWLTSCGSLHKIAMISRPPVRTSGIYSNCDRVVGGPEMLHLLVVFAFGPHKNWRDPCTYLYIFIVTSYAKYTLKQKLTTQT